MRRIIISGLVAALAIAAPATAAKPDHAQGKKPEKTKPVKKGYCVPKSVGFKAKGALVSHTLTQTAGADTEKTGDDRYSGDITVDVKKANHKAPTGEQTYTATNVRLKVRPKNTPAAAGDRVKVFGKITKLGKKCDATNFTPTITVRKIDIKSAA